MIRPLGSGRSAIMLALVLSSGAALGDAEFLSQKPLALTACRADRLPETVASTSGRSPDGDTVFQARYHPLRWSGDLQAFPLHGDTLGDAGWSAAARLDQRDLSSNPRNLVTFDGTQGIPFASGHWDDLTPHQQADLCALGRDWEAAPATPPARLPGWPVGCYQDTDGSISGDTTLAQALLGYLAGDRGGEGSGPGHFRPRDSRLGDIVHAAPLVVGRPRARYPDTLESKPYSTFAADKAGRRKMVYVGANDGMLHAFDATNGDERFAYLPAFLFSSDQNQGLHYLAEPERPNGYSHRYYVDLTAASSDVFFGDAWHTVLVGAARAGGKGIFALDITDPDTAAVHRPMWEFTDPDLGYGLSEIAIGRMNDGHWAAIFGNGYNNGADGTGSAQLFIVDVSDGHLIRKIDTGEGRIAHGGCGAPGSDCNGLSSPRIADLDGDGTIDRIYAGDLHGRLWIFDVAGAKSRDWGLGHHGGALFAACRATPCTPANRQPIRVRPAIARHPTRQGGATAPNIMVYFGTGRYLTESDPSDTATQSFYGVWDTGDGAGHATLHRDDLIAQRVERHNSGSALLRTLSADPVDYTGQPPHRHGWYIDLPEPGERVVTDPVTLGRLVWFDTLVPEPSVCNGGHGWRMTASLLNGGTPPFPAVDVNHNGTFGTADDVDGKHVAGVRVQGEPGASLFFLDRRVTATSLTAARPQIQKIRPLPPSTPSRMSWTHYRRH